MGYKSNEFKEVKWIINSLKSQLDSVNHCEAGTDDGKYYDSYEKEEDHGKRQRYKKGNTVLTTKRGTKKIQKN